MSSSHPISTDPAWLTALLADLPPLLTSAQAAQILQINPRVVPRIVARGELGAIGGKRVGHRMLIPRDALREYLLALGAA